MAISATHYQLLKRLQPLLPQGGSLLEIGEANWYGDVLPDFPVGEMRPYRDGGDARCNVCGNSCRKPAVFASTMDAYNSCFYCDEHAREQLGRNLFAIAKAFYQSLFAPRRIVSIDMNGTPAARRCDLNQQLPPLGLFDVVINHGTAEHVFHIAQVFASIHAACAVGGLMIHESPFTGWVDHGFYCLQPTLFYDLAAANGYEIVSVDVEEIKSGLILPVENRERVAEIVRQGLPDNSMLFVVLRKTQAEPFRIPMQGYYARSLSEAGKEAWETLR